MVRNISIFSVSSLLLKMIALSLIPATILVAGEFTASVSHTEVSLGESFPLNLTLKEISPNEGPDTSALKEQFLVHSQQQRTHTTILNGKVSSSIIWQLLLTPKREGQVEIPPITVKTSEGALSTQAITLRVVQRTSARSEREKSGPNIICQVSNSSPYKNEPFIYTALLTSQSPLYNLQTDKIQVRDAIVELLEEPKIEERVLDGVLHNVVEFTYLITPLKTGPLTIPSLTIQGAAPKKRKDQHSYRLHHDLDALIQGFNGLKPFSLMTDEVQIEVQPAIMDVSPWLPAKALTLEEGWPGNQILRVGEPFSRRFVIRGEGLKASQLPHLEELQGQNSTFQNSTFKVYADKPEQEEKVRTGTIQSTRAEQYTFIPQKEGTWVLPEISVTWWDSSEKKKRVSTIPARTVQILPALETSASAPREIAASFAPPEIQDARGAEEASPPSGLSPLLFYGVIGTLLCFLAAALLWVWFLHRKIARLTTAPSLKPIQPPAPQPKKAISPGMPAAVREKKEKLPDLNPT